MIAAFDVEHCLRLLNPIYRVHYFCEARAHFEIESKKTNFSNIMIKIWPIPLKLYLAFLSFGWIWVFLVLFACQAKTPQKMPLLRTVPADPADPALSPTARKLFARLCLIYGKTTLAGQVDYRQEDYARMLQYNYLSKRPDDYLKQIPKDYLDAPPDDQAKILEESRYVAIQYIDEKTGRKPVIVSLDLMDYSPSRREKGAEPSDLTQDAVLYANLHKMVLTLNWRWNAPMHLIDNHKEPWYNGYYAAATEFDLAQALSNPDSPEYQALIRDIDAIAAQLKLIADADVPVLWRPLHQAEGRWFWWGAKGPEAFKELWRLLFTRLTKHHQLHNLIWVLTSEDPAWYPGDDVVDIIGVDAYPADRRSLLADNWRQLQKQYNGRKLIALTEFGGVPNIEEMQKQGIWFSFFISWTDQNRAKLGPMTEDPLYLAKIYQSTSVVTLDEWIGIPAPAAKPMKKTQ
jgi:mannan endo-1,4-beta-mannosidase